MQISVTKLYGLINCLKILNVYIDSYQGAVYDTYTVLKIKGQQKPFWSAFKPIYLRKKVQNKIIERYFQNRTVRNSERKFWENCGKEFWTLKKSKTKPKRNYTPKILQTGQNNIFPRSFDSPNILKTEQASEIMFFTQTILLTSTS